MRVLGFRQTTIADAAVNLVPFAVLVFFLALYLVYDPWGPGLLSLVVGVGLLLVPIGVLLLATGTAAHFIQRDEFDEGGT